MAQAGGGQGAAVLSASGAVQSAAGLWARCLGACRSDVPGVDGALLSAIGYDLGIEGESLWAIVAGPGGLELERASTWTVNGASTNPRAWTYDATFSRAVLFHVATVARRGGDAFPVPAVEPSTLARCRPVAKKPNAGVSRCRSRGRAPRRSTPAGADCRADPERYEARLERGVPGDHDGSAPVDILSRGIHAGVRRRPGQCPAGRPDRAHAPMAGRRRPCR